MSGCASRIAAIPSRNSGWSSTARILIAVIRYSAGSIAPILPAGSGTDVGDHRGHSQADLRAVTGAAPHVQFRSHRFRPFAHARQPPVVASAALLEDLVSDSFPIVLHRNAKFVVAVSNGDVDPRGLGVTERIAKRLPGDAVNLVTLDRLKLPRVAFDFDFNSWRPAFRWSGSQLFGQGRDRAR